MDTVLRAALIYLGLLIALRATGRRMLGEMTTFDLILVLIISEAAQQALVGDNHSLTNAAIAVVTLMAIDVTFSLLTKRIPRLEKWVDGVPMIIVENGRPLEERMRQARVDENDVLSSARKLRGLERLDQIKYAVLEADGHITVVPNRPIV